MQHLFFYTNVRTLKEMQLGNLGVLECDTLSLVSVSWQFV